MTKNIIIESNKILEIISTKLESFREKKRLIEEKITSNTNEINNYETTIQELQEKLVTNKNNIELLNKNINNLDKIIDEIDTGYNTLIDTGQTIISLANSPE